MNFKISDLAPSGNECTEILLKLPAEAEKKIDSTPFDLLPPFAVPNPHFSTLVSRGDAENAAGYRLWTVCSFSCRLPNSD